MATTKTIAFTNGVFSSQDFPIETISDLKATYLVLQKSSAYMN